MLKRYLLLLFFIPLLFPHPAFAQDESVTFTTYYPSPYGDYNNLTTNNFIARENVTLATEPGSRVGIGTTDPAAKLHIQDTNTNPLMRVVGVGNQVFTMGFMGTGRFGIKDDGGTERFSIITQAGSSQGNVGIGVTAPAQKLDVNGGAAVRGTVFIGDGSSSNIRKTAAATPLSFTNSGGTAEMVIAGSGNVGIGTASPAVKLHVNGGSIQANSLANNWAGLFYGGGPYGIYTVNSQGYYDYLAYNTYGLYTNGNVYAAGQVRADGGFCIGGSCMTSLPGAKTPVYQCPANTQSCGPGLDAGTCVGSLSTSSTCTDCTGGVGMYTRSCTFAGYITQ